MFMTHLECSLTGERYDAEIPQNLSRVGKPLLARYDLGAVRGALTKEALAAAEPGMWKWRALLPLPAGTEPVSLGEPETPLISLDRVVQGARAERCGEHGAALRDRADRVAD